MHEYRKQPSSCVSHILKRKGLLPIAFGYLFNLRALTLLALALCACAGPQRVIVEKAPEALARHVYDRGARPQSQVKLHPSVEANTHWEFQFVPEIQVLKTKLEQNKDDMVATVRVKNVKIELALPIDMWLPESASEKVIAHENGHIEICKHFYKNADLVAHKSASAICDREFSGRGEDESACVRSAIEAASSILSNDYQTKIVLPAHRASAIYDKLTMHGQNSMETARAIEQSIKEAN